MASLAAAPAAAVSPAAASASAWRKSAYVSGSARLGAWGGGDQSLVPAAGAKQGFGLVAAHERPRRATKAGLLGDLHSLICGLNGLVVPAQHHLKIR
jgi:hypothetical protein